MQAHLISLFKKLAALAVFILLLVVVYHGWTRTVVWFMADRWNAAPSISSPRLGLGDYAATIEAQPIAGLQVNISGLTYSEASGTLYAAINRPPTIVELSLDGRLLRHLPLPSARDPEGISHVEGELFVVADEADNSLHWVRVPILGVAVETLHVTRLPLDFKRRNNRGFEGISWDQSRGQLLVSNEKWPRRVLKVRGLTPDDPAAALQVEPWHPRAWFGFLGNDLASLTTVAGSGHFLLLSEESAVVTEYTRAGEIVGVMPLWAGASGLQRTIPQAEGIAVGPRGAIFVVSEPNLFYRFTRTPGDEAIGSFAARAFVP